MSVVFIFLRSVRFDEQPVHVRVTLARIRYLIGDVERPKNPAPKITLKNQSEREYEEIDMNIESGIKI